MNERGDSIRVVHPLFQVEGGGSIPTSPLQLHIGEITPDIAIACNGLWHSRLPRVDKANIQRVSHLVCYGAEHENIFYSVAIWTDPIARVLNGRQWLELRRLAISNDAPKNTASRMLRVMAQMIQKKWPNITKLISYQDTAVHQGTIYKAAGWLAVETARSGCNWDVPSRRRTRPTENKIATPKIRWELDLKKGAHYAEKKSDGASTFMKKSTDLFADTASASILVVGAANE